MKIRNTLSRWIGCGFVAWLMGSGLVPGQSPPIFSAIQTLTNREVLLKLTATAGTNCSIEASQDTARWASLVTLASASGMNQYTDSAAPFLESRYYRAKQREETNVVTGDHLMTEAGDLVIHPVDHASFVMAWQGTQGIYCDPVGGAAKYRGMPRPFLILITHDHGDHLDLPTLNGIGATNAQIVTPQVVYQKLSAALKAVATVMTNGQSINLAGLTIEALPMYNLKSTHHQKGVGNGYVLTMGGHRIYVAGDTEDIPEMRALQSIDVAFIPMNLPYTMTVSQAAAVVREFQPKVVYPYHSRGSDVNLFKQQVGTDLGIEVRLRKWY
jgi:L-ascorbate metabolism protein UlaG (beta-lactamase superfamily)